MTSGKGIPFVDLVAPHVELQGELLGALRGVLSTGMFVGGPNVEQFEQEFAKFTGADSLRRCQQWNRCSSFCFDSRRRRKRGHCRHCGKHIRGHRRSHCPGRCNSAVCRH